MSQKSVEWRLSDDLVDYETGVAFMERRVAEIRQGKSPETVWLLEHPPLYTAGTSADAQELLDPRRFPVHKSGRGGRYTYHGPGQRVAYVMLDLSTRGNDVRAFVRLLEDWIIAVLGVFGILGEIRDDRIGIWVVSKTGREEKIAAIGVRVRRWVTYHGVAINVAPDLDHFSSIMPCGISGGASGYGVTSLKQFGVDCSMVDIDKALQVTFQDVFATSIIIAPQGHQYE